MRTATSNNVFPLSFSCQMSCDACFPYGYYLEISVQKVKRPIRILIPPVSYYILYKAFRGCSKFIEALQSLEELRKGLEKLKGIWESRWEGKRVELLDFTEVNYLWR